MMTRITLPTRTSLPQSLAIFFVEVRIYTVIESGGKEHDIREIKTFTEATTTNGNQVSPCDLYYCGHRLTENTPTGVVHLLLDFINLRGKRIRDLMSTWDTVALTFDQCKGKKARVTKIEVLVVPSPQEFGDMLTPTNK